MKNWSGSRLNYSTVWLLVCVADSTNARKLVPRTSWSWCNSGTNRNQKILFRIIFYSFYIFTFFAFTAIFSVQTNDANHSYIELKYFWKATTMIRKKIYNIYLSYVFIFKSLTEHVQTKALYKTEYRFCL